MKKFLCLLFVFIMCATLVACNDEDTSNPPSPKNYVLEGTYAHSHIHEGDEITIIISLKADDTYLKTVVKDGRVSSNESGDYELIDDKLYLYDSDAVVYHGSSTVYTFKNGTLNGPETVYKKISEDK